MAKWNLDRLDNGADEGHATVKWQGRSYSIEVQRVQFEPVSTSTVTIVGTVKSPNGTSTT
jgi:hypothetical protein